MTAATKTGTAVTATPMAATASFRHAGVSCED
jgi:hypothetical protein